MLALLGGAIGCGDDEPPMTSMDTAADVESDTESDTASDVESDTESDTSPDGLCVPDCVGRTCGSDGCGGLCGSCSNDTQCTELGQCVAIGCIPDCFERVCGDDGCGGTCGECLASTPFCVGGLCVPECVPDCRQRSCGDDGCGGSCGACAGTGACSEFGTCVPSGWTCSAALHADGSRCDCGCGAVDPDCEVVRLPVVGCQAFDRCPDGVCSPRTPSTWTCDPLAYGDDVRCDCRCGAADPDCANRELLVVGCTAGEQCGEAGTCVPCAPDCTDRVCGNDGCGGSCGECADGDPDTGVGQEACVSGACIDGCTPTPALCDVNACGDDGCGGSCGTCPSRTLCVLGQCEIEPGMSCRGLCGTAAPGGCGCDTACIAQSDCCPDFLDRCYCLANCVGRACGDDGCGGSCGGCPNRAAPFCDAAGACGATCVPDCRDKQCGDDGCGGSCGSCEPGGQCNDRQLCVPPTWGCPPFTYGDETACDCSCGAPDPDCETFGLTFNCPLGAACVAATGVCDIAFCGSDSQCSGNQRCVGHFATGSGARLGVCSPPLGTGRPDGFPCATDAGCASEVCANGICRAHCQADDDCQGGEACVAVPIVDAIAGDPLGLVSVCDALATTTTCARQSVCSQGAPCLAIAHPTTFQPIYRCGTGDAGRDLGEACDPTLPCSTGLVCANATCVLPCPGGVTDCAPDSSCEPTTLHGGASALAGDDVLVPACAPR